MDDQSNTSIQSLSSLLSEDALRLLASTGANLLESIGIDVMRDVILDVLTGKNIRSSTENLTRHRISKLNLALLNLIFKGTALQDDFAEQLPGIAVEILSHRISKTETWLANWAIGLTGKGVQNILWDDLSLVEEYVKSYVEGSKAVAEQARQQYGELTGKLSLENVIEVPITWLNMLYLFNMVGSETLTIRGSEKSLYGKFFEKLILGSVLHILGFSFDALRNSGKAEKIFWLSSNTDRGRESDATIFYQPGRGVRIDIGFIGRGNTEISLDKVARYRREIELGGQHYFMGTIIIVDRIGQRSNIRQLAEEIDGRIIQMSAGYWPRRIATELNRLLGFDHPLIHIDDTEIEAYLRAKLNEVPLRDFIRTTIALSTSDENAE